VSVDLSSNLSKCLDFCKRLVQINGESLDSIKRIALVAHDKEKRELAEWVQYNWKTLVKHDLISTGTTGRLVEETMIAKAGDVRPEGLRLTLLKSGPLGGDQQVGVLIAEGKIDIMIFFLGSYVSPSPRRRCQSPFEDSRSLQHSHGL
jgi:Methylglyoxal synthase